MTKLAEMDVTKKKPEAGGARRGLGRGLSALFEDDEDQFAAAHAPVTPSPESVTGSGALRRLAGTDQLEPGTFQPRQHIAPDSLRELSESIAVHGVLQPILVRLKPGFDDKFEIIAGERRWRAAQAAHLHEVPVIVKTLDDVQAMEIALIENLQRADLDVLEEAHGYQRLMDEFGHTQEKLAASLSKSRSHIANTLRLLSLPIAVQTFVRQGRLSAGHARALVTAPNAEAMAIDIIHRGLSVRETEALVARAQSGKGRLAKKSAGKDVDTLALEKEISNAIGMKVSIDMKGDGKSGALKVDFKNLDQLDDVLKRLSQNPVR